MCGKCPACKFHRYAADGDPLWLRCAPTISANRRREVNLADDLKLVNDSLACRDPVSLPLAFVPRERSDPQPRRRPHAPRIGVPTIPHCAAEGPCPSREPGCLRSSSANTTCSPLAAFLGAPRSRAKSNRRQKPRFVTLKTRYRRDAACLAQQPDRACNAVPVREALDVRPARAWCRASFVAASGYECQG